MALTVPCSPNVHHLNQDAAFRDRIPTDEGASVKIEGNAFTEPGTPHYEAHKSLEIWWNKFRRGGINFGKTPSNLAYTRALMASMSAAGFDGDAVYKIVRSAIKNRVNFNLLGGEEVPRIPGRINQKKPVK
jgi:hypothetical protein